MSKSPSYVAYYRVSTKQQGRSGLGLEAQREAVGRYISGREGQPIAEYTEVESGKRNDRPELGAALAACRRSQATLVIAKLDRLARNVAFVASLMESGVPFVTCDRIGADAFQLHIEAAIGEREAKAISERTRAALAARKARGLPMGAQIPECRNMTKKQMARGRALGRATRTAAAIEADVRLLGPVRELRAKGLSLRAIAGHLADEMGVRTGKGNPLPPTRINRILSRVE